MVGNTPSGQLHVFDLYGPTALAWFFVMANWQDEGEKPDFQSRGGGKLIFCLTRRSLDEIHRVLGRSMLHGGALAESGIALLHELRDRGIAVLPEISRGESAAG